MELWIDGIDMCVTFSYCFDNNIPVEMIDYWEITNDSKTNTTTDERDDHIHNNIMKKLVNYENKKNSDYMWIWAFERSNRTID